MFARVTSVEIDTQRIEVAQAVELFRTGVLPAVSRLDGFAGVVVLSTPAGKGLLISLWETEEAAEAGADSGFYPDVLREHMVLFRSPPGRERYEVAVAQWPGAVVGT